MAVTTTVTMPEQPASGRVVYRPLGGNGLRSPLAMASVSIKSTGDASAGNHQVTCVIDSTYMFVPTCVLAGVTNPGAAFDIRIDVVPTPFFGFSWTIGGNISTAIDYLSATPPPLVMEHDDSAAATPRIYCIKDNVNAEELELRILFYLFRRRAAELVPIEDIFSSVPRGQSVFPG